jgi:6-pyruvoyltetrahydropterin/6-carboxytetrahydropterin synthase
MNVTACYRFSAAHRLHSDALGEQANWDVYGKCNNPYGHGHNYSLEVTVEGTPDPVTGMAVDRFGLDRVVRQEILSRVEHRHLNVEVEALRGAVPTTENVAYAVNRLLREKWQEYLGADGPRLKRVRIYETRNNRFEVEAHEEQ